MANGCLLQKSLLIMMSYSVLSILFLVIFLVWHFILRSLIHMEIISVHGTLSKKKQKDLRARIYKVWFETISPRNSFINKNRMVALLMDILCAGETFSLGPTSQKSATCNSWLLRKGELVSASEETLYYVGVCICVHTY